MIRHIYVRLAVLALSLVGSVSLLAQTSDPFPAVKPGDFYGNMSMSVKVILNEQPVTNDVIVAVYSDNEIRGKGKPTDESNPGAVFLTVYGNQSGEPLYFKVYTQGHLVEVTPDDFTYTYNGIVGTPAHPYVVDISSAVESVNLLMFGANSQTVKDCNGSWANVTLEGRTLYKDGNWNTLTLPFDVDLTADGCPLAGATARTVTDANITGNTLYLTFGAPVNKLLAGVPYIIKWDEDTEHPTIDDPRFLGVTIKNVHDNFDNGATGELHVRFMGTYDSNTYDTADQSILFMSNDNQLYYPDGLLSITIPACYAYFKIGNGEVLSRIRNFNIDFSDETSGLKSLKDGNVDEWRDGTETVKSDDAVWYTLSGIRLSGRPAKKGVYINAQGKKMIVQ